MADEYRFLVTVVGDEIEKAELFSEGPRWRSDAKGIRRRKWDALGRRLACNEYIVWAKDELDAYVRVSKMRRGEGGNPFEKGNPFDA